MDNKNKKPGALEMLLGILLLMVLPGIFPGKYFGLIGLAVFVFGLIRILKRKNIIITDTSKITPGQEFQGSPKQLISWLLISFIVIIIIGAILFGFWFMGVFN